MIKIEELSIDINDDYDFDVVTEKFNKNGMYALQISGSTCALKEFGNFLINIAMFRTKDEDYHEHLETIKGGDGKTMVNITVRKNK